jgi:predicted PP-loop superfamily ATPase
MTKKSQEVKEVSTRRPDTSSEPDPNGSQVLVDKVSCSKGSLSSESDELKSQASGLPKSESNWKHILELTKVVFKYGCQVYGSYKRHELILRIVSAIASILK